MIYTLLRFRATRAAGLLALASALLLAHPPRASAASTPHSVTLRPAQPWRDSRGNRIQAHGAGLLHFGSSWYWFGEDKHGESAHHAFFQDIPCYASRDLGHWRLQRFALTRQPSGDLGPHRIVERPKVIYNRRTRQFVMYLHIDSPDYREARVGVATSSRVCGPYTYRGSFRPLGFQSRDIGLFQDTGGRAYLLSEDRANGLRIDALSPDYLHVVRPVALLPDREAPAMFKSRGRYYLLASHLSGWHTNDNQYATATSLAGPWSPLRNFAPAGTNTFNTQTAFVLPVHGRHGTVFIYCGDRWTPSDLGSSPYIWLPLEVHGTSVSLHWYSHWQLNPTAGAWAPSPGTAP